MSKRRDRVGQLALVARDEASRGSVASAAASAFFEEGRKVRKERNKTPIEWTHQPGFIGSTFRSRLW